MKSFLIRHRSALRVLSLLLVVFTVALLMSGCAAPTWLTDANQIIGMVGSSIAAIGGFIAALTGNAALAAGLAVVSTWLTKIEQGIADVEQLVEQYNAAPDATTLASIEAALLDVETNIQQDFSNLGLPTSVTSVIAGVAALALSQLQAWGTMIPAIKANAMQSFVLKVPYTKAQFKEAVNGILSTPTGDAEVDAALAKAKKL